MSHRKIAALILVAGIGLTAPAMAQDASEPRVNQLIIYGDDACPPSTDGEITVCARKDEDERFRIPTALREDEPRGPNEAWTQRVQSYETVGASGTNSCSPVGAGGFTGCMVQLIDTAYRERDDSNDVRFGELIAAERAKRLATIDADAAETQSEVERIEAEYLERQRATDEAAMDQAEASEGALPQPE